jgi:hypothetical protein
MQILVLGGAGRPSAFFTFQTGQSHHISFAAARLQDANTASWATAMPLQQSWPVNNPDKKYFLRN